MQAIRMFRHLLLPAWWVRRDFPRSLLRAVEDSVRASELRHSGELRLVVEANLPLHGIMSGQSARARAIELFSQMRVWDTRRNSGVLIYLQLLDRRVEIVADRGIDAKVGQEFWAAVCRRMETAFRERRFEEGLRVALAEVTEVLALHFPSGDVNPNELPDTPLML